MAAGILQVIYFALSVLIILIIIQAILSWLVVFNVVPRYGAMANFIAAINRMTDPIYRPIRKVMPDFGGIDFSPIVVLLIIQVLRILISNAIDRMPM